MASELHKTETLNKTRCGYPSCRADRAGCTSLCPHSHHRRFFVFSSSSNLADHAAAHHAVLSSENFQFREWTVLCSGARGFRPFGNRRTSCPGFPSVEAGDDLKVRSTPENINSSRNSVACPHVRQIQNYEELGFSLRWTSGSDIVVVA